MDVCVTSPLFQFPFGIVGERLLLTWEFSFFCFSWITNKWKGRKMQRFWQVPFCLLRQSFYFMKVHVNLGKEKRNDFLGWKIIFVDVFCRQNDLMVLTNLTKNEVACDTRMKIEFDIRRGLWNMQYQWRTNSIHFYFHDYITSDFRRHIRHINFANTKLVERSAMWKWKYQARFYLHSIVFHFVINFLQKNHSALSVFNWTDNENFNEIKNSRWNNEN